MHFQSILGGKVNTLLRSEITDVSEAREALTLAIMNDNTDRIREIKEKFPEVINMANKDGQPFLLMTIAMGKGGAFDLIVNDPKVMIEVKDEHGHNGLHIAAMRRRREMAISLISKKLNPARDNNGKKPSYWAHKSGEQDLARALQKYELKTSLENTAQRRATALKSAS